MKNMKARIIAILILCLLAITGCSSGPSENISAATEDLSAPPIESDTAPTLAPTQMPDDQPAGILTYPSGTDGESLSYFNANGEFVTAIDTPGLGNAGVEDVYAAGSQPSGDISVPVVYQGWDPEQTLKVATANKVSTLRKVNGFLALCGAQGQTAMAFSEVTIDNNIPHSYLYAGNLENLASVVPFYDLLDEATQMALMPVAVDAVNGQPQGVWYTKSAWGIGGVDLMFAITRGLYYFDLASGDNSPHLEADRNFQGISPDHQLAGSVDFNTEGDLSMTITNLGTGDSFHFSQKPGYNRGSGWAVFAPDNQHMAWLEASGYFFSEPANFHAIVRVGDLGSRNVIVEVDNATVAQMMSSGTASFIKPVGWLDNQSLLIEVRGEDWGEVSLMKLNLPDRTLSYFADGSFVGFVY